MNWAFTSTPARLATKHEVSLNEAALLSNKVFDNPQMQIAGSTSTMTVASTTMSNFVDITQLISKMVEILKRVCDLQVTTRSHSN